VDIDSFSDAAPEVQKKVIPDAAVEPPVAATDTTVPQSVHPHDGASPEFTKELELTIHRGEDPVQDAPLLEIREKVLERQAPSPSLAAFNKNFGTSHHGELLSVGFEAASIGDGASKILTLWESPTLVDETGEGVSKQTSRLPGEAVRDSGKKPCSSSKRTFISLQFSLPFCPYFHLFAFTFPTYNLLFFLRLHESAMTEGVLAGLPTLEQPCLHQLRRGPSRADVRRFTAGSSRHTGQTALHRRFDCPLQRSESASRPLSGFW
jgi:hypothetical protein